MKLGYYLFLFYEVRFLSLVLITFLCLLLSSSPFLLFPQFRSFYFDAFLRITDLQNLISQLQFILPRRCWKLPNILKKSIHSSFVLLLFFPSYSYISFNSKTRLYHEYLQPLSFNKRSSINWIGYCEDELKDRDSDILWIKENLILAFLMKLIQPWVKKKTLISEFYDFSKSFNIIEP